MCSRFRLFRKFRGPKVEIMDPLVDPELIEKLKRDFPSVLPTNLTCVYADDELMCYKDVQTAITYLFDKSIDAWLKEETEYWRGIPIS